MLFLTSSFQYLLFGLSIVLIMVFILIIGVIIYGYREYKQLISQDNWSKIIEEKILEAVIYGHDKVTSLNENNNFFNNFKFRNFFLKKLVASEKKFSGNAENEIINLFDEYHLEKEALQKLNQKKEYLIALGIQELTSMKTKTAIPKIETFLHHPSLYVRQEAQYSMVTFKGFEGLEFLNKTQLKISEWQQLRLLLSIHEIPEKCDSDIKNWLFSDNESVVIFTLCILRKFQMLSFYDDVFSLLATDSIEIKTEAIQTILALENYNTLQDLIKVFDFQPLEVQIEILNSMKIAKDERCQYFLEQQLLNHPSSEVKLYAAESLVKIGKETLLQEILQNYTSVEPIYIIIKQALQEKV